MKAYGDDETLNPEDIFDEEIDTGELAEIANSLVVPTGRYFPETPFPFKQKTLEFSVQSKDGSTYTKSIRLIGFWGKVLNEEGQEFRLGLDLSNHPLYFTGAKKDNDQVLYDFPAPGAKPYYVTKNFHQAIKLYKKANGVIPVNYGELIEFLRVTPLRLENRVREASEGYDASSFVVGFNLADA